LQQLQEKTAKLHFHNKFMMEYFKGIQYLGIFYFC